MRKYIYTSIICLLITTSMAMTLQAQDVLNIKSGTVVSSTGGVVITLRDMDLHNDGIFTQGIGQGTVVFNGSASNSISGNSIPLFDMLQLSKTGGGNITLQRGISIGSGITFNGGILDLNAQNILLSSIASLINESETSHITGTNGGYTEINTTLTAPSDVNPGNLGAVFTSSQDLGSVVIRRGHQSQTNFYGNGSTILRYYDIMPINNTVLNAKFRFNYLDAELNSIDENKLTMWTSTDNQNWTNLNYNARNASDNFVEQEGINSFSRFTLTELTNPLPLKWGSFNTQCISGQTKISWKTLQEQNTTVFVIQRSTDGRTWTTAGSVPAAGNSQSALSYSFTDPQSLGGNTYYQVYEQDFDGRRTFSPVLASECSQPENIKVYPIPAKNNCWVSIQSERSQSIAMHLYNVQGALLKQQSVNVQPGNNVFELSLAEYPSGIYSLMFIMSDGKVKVIKVEKN
jgi:hypothetical protein